MAFSFNGAVKIYSNVIKKELEYTSKDFILANAEMNAKVNEEGMALSLEEMRMFKSQELSSKVGVETSLDEKEMDVFEYRTLSPQDYYSKKQK